MIETRERLGPQPKPGLMDIVTYKGGSSGAPGTHRVVKLSSNENALGCSPHARQAFIDSAASLALYPDGSARALREAIGEVHGLDPARIVCGAGSDELLQLVTRGYAGPGDEIVYSQYGFLVYRLAARQAGATPVAAPETNLTADVDALLAAVTQRTKVVFLANPNNPTGTLARRGEIERLHAGLPEHVLLVLDGAYAEYVRGADYDAGVELAGRAANVVMMRTFSKIHGLAALRLGWAYGPQAVIDVIHRLRGPFNVSAPAIAAGTAAVRDQDFARRSADHNDAELARIGAAMQARGLLAAPSVGNFLLLRFADPAKSADAALAFLKARGLYVREMTPYQLPDCLRITLGAAADNDLVVEALDAFLAA